MRKSVLANGGPKSVRPDLLRDVGIYGYPGIRGSLVVRRFIVSYPNPDGVLASESSLEECLFHSNVSTIEQTSVGGAPYSPLTNTAASLAVGLKEQSEFHSSTVKDFA